MPELSQTPKLKRAVISLVLIVFAAGALYFLLNTKPQTEVANQNPPPPPPPSQAAEKYSTYKNVQFGIEFLYPESMTDRSTNEPDTQFTAFTKAGEQVLSNIGWDQKKFPNSNFTKGFVLTSVNNSITTSA